MELLLSAGRSLILITISLLLVFSVAAHTAELPLRATYPHVATIDIEDLYTQLNDVVVVDVRSVVEYDTLHIKGALHIAISNAGFIPQVKSLRSATDKTIVFYCNGVTCQKSYQATEKATDSGILGIKAYDEGIFAWAKKYPEHSVLLGKSPINPERLISNEDFSKHLLSPAMFVERLTADAATAFDIRDSFQRAGKKILPEVTRPVTFSNLSYLLVNYPKDRPLYIYDAVGKQVRWAQYKLEDVGLQNYYFMEGGVKGYEDAGLE